MSPYAELDDVPLDVAGVDHGLDLGRVGRSATVTVIPVNRSNGSM